MTKVYFNELSAQGSVDEANVKQCIEDLLASLKHLRNKNVDAVIVNGSLGRFLISNKRNVYQILSDKNVLDNDSATFLIEHFQEEYLLREEIEDNDIVSARCGERDAVGLTLASDDLNKGIALSLSHAGWDDIVYNLQLEVLDENGDVEELSTSAANASTKATLELYDGIFPVSSIQVPESGKLLFFDLADQFPNLVFSADAKSFIKRCQSKVTTAQVFWKLYDLNNVAIKLGGKPFDKKMFTSKASPESATRENMSELDVMFEDCKVRHCSWHLRYTPGAGRIHFSSDSGDGETIYIWIYRTKDKWING